MNYFIIGTAIIIVGAGVYYLINRDSNTRRLTTDQISIKNTDSISLADLGPWLKEKDVDLDDFRKNLKLFAFKNIRGNQKVNNLPKDVLDRLNSLGDKKTICFTLSDNDLNTKQVLIVIGDSIDPKLESILTKDVTELHLK